MWDKKLITLLFRILFALLLIEVEKANRLGRGEAWDVSQIHQELLSEYLAWSQGGSDVNKSN